MSPLNYALLWIFLAAAFAFLTGSLNLPGLHRLVTHGVRGQGTVEKLTPEIHNTLVYRFQVDGNTYEKQRSPWRPNPSIDQLSVGQTVTVYYDPANPDISVPGDPGPMFENEIISVGLATFLAPTFIVFVVAFRKPRQPASRTEAQIPTK